MKGRMDRRALGVENLSEKYVRRSRREGRKEGRERPRLWKKEWVEEPLMLKE